jgi:outer membrane receptor for ferrienterochelin and colicin
LALLRFEAVKVRLAISSYIYCMRLVILLACLATHVIHAQKFTINGFVRDSISGEPLMGSSVTVAGSIAGTVANVHGYYSLSLSSATVKIVYSHVGYGTQSKTVLLVRDTTLHVVLSSNTVLDTVVITGERSEFASPTGSSLSIPIDRMKALPAILGEVDLLKVLQLTPGIKYGEGSTGLYVRGGGSDQNLMLLDGVPVYNASHLFGFFSTFNSDAISRVDLFKGGFPARYGGRLSSIIDVRMKEGNLKDFQARGSVSLIAANITVEGPIKKDKASFLVSARRTYADLLIAPFIRLSQSQQPFNYFFYDLNAKLNYRIDGRNTVLMSGYLGSDKGYATQQGPPVPNTVQLDSEEKTGIKWGNVVASLSLNSVLTPKLFATHTVLATRYKFGSSNHYSEVRQTDPETPRVFNSEYRSRIFDLGIKADYEFMPTPSNHIRFGAAATRHLYEPSVNFSTLTASVGSENEDTRVHALEFGAYVEDQIDIGQRLQLNIGGRFDAFLLDSRYYKFFQPRLSAKLRVGENFTITTSYQTVAQFAHLLTNPGLGFPTDLWVPSTASIPPETARQISFGGSMSFSNIYMISIEGYYKQLENVIEYKNSTFVGNSSANWEYNVLTGGNGKTYGVELLAQKQVGKLAGWVGYTLSWAYRQFDQINQGSWYPFKYDRRHDVSVALTYKLNPRVEFSAAWVFSTGNALTLPSGKFVHAISPGSFNQLDMLDYYGDRNSFRMPNYHRLDLSATFKKEKKWGQRKWSFGFYNTYNRRNPYFIRQETDGAGKKVLVQYTLFPVIPFVAFGFEYK